MDLRTWILGELDFTEQRMQNQVLVRVPRERWRERPGDDGGSLAWILFHTAYHHDVALNAVVRGGEPLFASRCAGLALDGIEPGTGMGEADDPDVRAAIDLDALDDYWFAVHRTTRAWVESTDLAELDRVPDAHAGLADRAGVPDTTFGWLHAMWDAKPAWFLLQWEAVGHVQNHVGEAVALRNRMGLSPF